MSSTTTWGALVAASLAAGCSAAPAQPAGPAPVASAPPPFRPSLSPPLDVLPEPSEGEDEDVGSLFKTEIPYGRGVLLYENIERGGVPLCPLVRDDGCSFHTVSSNGKNPDKRAWLDGSSAPPSDARPGKRLPSPRDWVSFFASNDSIFALAKGGKIIDRIDDQGQVTRLAQDNAMEGWHQLRIVEQGDRLMALGQAKDESLVVGEILPAASASEPRKLGPLAVLPMSPIPPQRQTAQGAREVVHAGKLAMAGTPRFVSLPDEGDKKNLWAMVWLEAVPPPFDWPAGKPRSDGAKAAPKAPPKAQGKAQGKAQTKGAKHDCGGPPSRSLADLSVEKKAHVSRFSAATLLDDKVVWTTNAIDPWRLLAVRLDEGKLVVEPSTEKSPSPPLQPSARYETLFGRSVERLVAAAFDAETKEGLVVVRSGKKLFSRRFDAEGAFLGEPVVYPHDLRGGNLDLVRSGKNWLVRSHDDEIHNLTGGSPPQRLEPGDYRVLDLVPGQPHAHMLLEDKDRSALYMAPLDEQGKSTGDPELVVAFDKGMVGIHGAVQIVPGSPPIFAILQRLDEIREVHQFSSRNRLAWAWLKPASSWTYLPELPQTPPAKTMYEGLQTVSYKHVDGDLVAWLPQGKQSLLAWVRAGKVISVADAPEHNALSGELYRERTTGNILGKGELRLPTQPGPPVASPELAEAERECAYVMPTGPATTVLACARPTDPSQIAIRVSLRLHRSEPPASR